jgi:ATP-dependent DNA ligase
MQELLLLQAIANESSKNRKRHILKANAHDQRLIDLLDAALNYKRRYYIKKWETPTSQVISNADKHPQFMALLKDLESQKYRGDAATKLVETFLLGCTALEQDWYSKILRKDLKAGFGIDSAIDCGFDIPLFEVQLAKDGHECKKLDAMIRAGMLASRKYDGYRCLTVVDPQDQQIYMFTRNGEEFHNFESVKDSLAKLFFADKSLPPALSSQLYVFDGEIMSANFQSMQKSAFASKRRTTVGDVVYEIFDMIPYSEWASENFDTPAFTRYMQLTALFKGLEKTMKEREINNLRVVEKVLIVDRQHILDLEAKYIAEGYEGVMANPNIPYYKGKKSNRMLKFKTFLSMDCEVIRAYKGDQLSKYKDTLGGFTVQQENGVTCDVGGGYDDSERDDMWNGQTALLGRVMEVKYQNLTEDDKKMRFPVFCRWRTDKDKQ